MCRVLKIAGDSLKPDFCDGDYVFTSKLALRLRSVHTGDVVVFRMAPYGILIKRVDRVLPGGKEVFVLGSGPLSTDSRLFGAVPIRELSGRVIYHLKRQP